MGDMVSFRILYLSRDMYTYIGAMYQRDVMDELARQTDVSFYGPGFPNYDKADTLKNVINKRGGNFDAVVLGHAWLSDREGTDVDPHPGMDWQSVGLPKAVILNKEYVNLDAKLDFIRRSGFDIGFTHHHDVEVYTEATSTPFVFWPFAFDERRYGGAIPEKKLDFSFSGILQNQNPHANQSDTRVRIMNRFFHCVGDVPLLKRRRYLQYSILWNAIPRSRWQARLAGLLGRYRFMPEQEYRDMQAKSRIYLNTLSPAGLVSPRLFENMAIQALVFCEDAPNYSRIFPEDCYITFRSDMSDFEDKLLYYLNNEEARLKVVKRAHTEAWSNHTWRMRVEQLLEKLRRI